MNCSSCGHLNREQARFCEHCGVALPRTCAGCGAEFGPEARYCDVCAHPAAVAAKSPVRGGTAAAVRPIDRLHNPALRPLADKMLRAISSLEGERKQVTVLFADVIGSMEMAEGMDPEAWSEIMQRFFQILCQGVERFEGFVDKFTGDGIMALFGAPFAHEDHALRACYAALHLRDALRANANELRLRRGLNFSVRMGINSGEVIVGKIGEDLHMDYTAQGHTVGLAARMEQIAEPGKAYLTAHTAAQVKDYFALGDLGAMEIKGVQEPMHVYELQGLGQMRTRMDVSRSRGFSHFVGRAGEMKILESALDQAREGDARIIGIVGEAGLGKSRLCYEFLERCRARGMMTYETAGIAQGQAIPFLPVQRLFRAFYGITERDSDATARERIAGRILLLDERLRESLPLNFDFMGVPDPENPTPRIDPEARQRQMFDIVRRMVQALGKKEPSVILLEDLHWFDGASAALLQPMIDAATRTRSLVLLNYRPDYEAPWRGQDYYREIALSPLGPDAIREMLDGLIGRDPSTAGLAEAIYARTGGNPFFTEEVLLSLIESGKLQGIKGAHRLLTPVDKLEVPDSVHAILAARIDRLTERDKDVLQTAAVIGREFDERTLAAIVGQDEQNLRDALQALKHTEFIYELSLYPVAEYLFKHPLTQEVALASQLQERRRRLHAAVAHVIEAAHASDLDRQAALLAHHWEEASDLTQAVRWHRHAAEWAGARDPVEGVRHWRKVRELGRPLAEEEVKESRLRACGAILTGGAWRLGLNEEEVRSCMDEARALARELNRPTAIAAPLAGFATRLGVSGQAETALSLAGEARGMLGEGMDLDEVFAVECLHAYWLLVAGRLADALDAFDAIVQLSGGDAQLGRELIGYSPLLWAEHMAAWTLAQAGRFDECWPREKHAIQMARAHSAQENLGWALGGPSTFAYLARGSSRVPSTDARPTFLGSQAPVDGVGGRYSEIYASYSLGVGSLISGDNEASEACLVEALKQACAAGNALDWQSYFLTVCADASLAAGRVEAAIERAREAIAVADRGGARFQAALARAACIDALIRNNSPESEIEVLLAEARELIRRTGGQSLSPRLREAEARLAGRENPVALEEGLREAESRYRAMGTPDPADRLTHELGFRR